MRAWECASEPQDLSIYCGLTDFHHRLDHARLRLGEAREVSDQVLETRAVRDPGPRVDLPRLDQLDDSLEVARQRVAAGEERHLARVEEGVGKADLRRHDADVH